VNRDRITAAQVAPDRAAAATPRLPARARG
jgi:hypothetical protein